jgi:23S rRNA G2069 N7-methylase RlmK/C1962 C5-methylase RlmI
METIKPPPYKNEKWSSFLENYFLLMNSKKQFLRKGGLFSEFSNKNIGSINNNKYDIQQRLKKEKMEKEKMKEEKSPSRKSSSK